MSASATKSEFATFLARMDKWERTKNGSHSNLRDSSKRTQRRVAKIMSSLSEVESMIALDAFRACTVCDQSDDNDGITPRFRRWHAFVDRQMAHKSNYQHAEFYALLAPVWNVLNGKSGNPGYSMSQAIYTIRDEVGSMDISFVMKGERAEELRAKLIGVMMYNDNLRITGMNYEDAEWCGANWERIAPVWHMLKTGDFSRGRVEAMIEHQKSGGAVSISSGVL